MPTTDHDPQIVQALDRMKELVAGHTYYRVTYADPGMTMPSVEPLVYLGDTDPSEASESFHTFQDALSYAAFGSRLDAGENQEDMDLFFIPPSDIAGQIVDVQQATLLVSDASRRAADLGNPILPARPKGEPE